LESRRLQRQRALPGFPAGAPDGARLRRRGLGAPRAGARRAEPGRLRPAPAPMPRSPEIRVEGASNAAIARVFDEMADLLEIEDANPFRVRAYRNAARLIEGLGVSLAEMLARGEDPDDLPGIGKDLAAKIAEIVRTGTCQAHEELRRRLPPTITTLLRVPGLGPRRVQTLHRSLDISTPAQLRAAAEAGRIRALPGFGEKTEAAILQALGAQA